MLDPFCIIGVRGRPGDVSTLPIYAPLYMCVTVFRKGRKNHLLVDMHIITISRDCFYLGKQRVQVGQTGIHERPGSYTVLRSQKISGKKKNTGRALRMRNCRRGQLETGSLRSVVHLVGNAIMPRSLKWTDSCS